MGESFMAEPLHLRVRRILAARIEDAVSALERSGGPGVMREAVREVERVIDDVQSDRTAATARRLTAVRQEKMVQTHVAELAGKARFALEQGREDLAEAAISRQVDIEGQLAPLALAQSEAATEEARLDEALAALGARKAQMEQALKAWEQAHREAGTAQAAPASQARGERAVARAEEAFDRAMDGAGGIAFTRADATTLGKVAELDVLQRSAVVAERMAALRTAAG
jgi:phage shock protein A